MGVPTGSGRELIKIPQITDLTNSAQTLITGVANHIYTVISIIACETAGGAEAIQVYLADSDGSSNPLYILRNQAVNDESTFVFNDRFSFTGGTQKLQIITTTAANVDVICTYIDQDWT